MSPNTTPPEVPTDARSGDLACSVVDVSVVVPVRNEAAHLGAVLKDLLRQKLGDLRLEILVVDGRSTDTTRDVVARHAAEDPRVRLLDNPARLSSAARARGCQAARGRFVAIVDGHCRIPSATLLADMVALFERTGASCLSRPQPLVPGEFGRMAKAISAARTSPLGHSTQSTIYDNRERQVEATSAGAMYRREVFDRVGHFDPAFDACEDVEFNWRCDQAGLPCWSSPALAIHYEPRRTLRALFKQMRRYGLGRARLHRKHPAAFGWESLVPLGFVLGLPVAALGAWLLPPPWRWWVVAPYALYAALVLFASVAAARKTGWSLLPLIAAVFPTIHVGLGVGYLKGLFTSPPRPFAARGAPLEDGS